MVAMATVHPAAEVVKAIQVLAAMAVIVVVLAELATVAEATHMAAECQPTVPTANKTELMIRMTLSTTAIERKIANLQPTPRNYNGKLRRKVKMRRHQQDHVLMLASNLRLRALPRRRQPARMWLNSRLKNSTNR